MELFASGDRHLGDESGFACIGAGEGEEMECEN